jgi:hypothetical protein
MLSESTNDPLDLLVNRLLDDGDLSAADCASLANTLQRGIDAQATYVDFVILDELLKETFLEVSGTLNKSILALLAQSAKLDEKKIAEHHAILSNGSSPIANLAPSPSNVAPTTPVLRLLGVTIRSVSRSSLVVTLLIATLIYGVFAYLAWDLHPSKFLRTAQSGSESVATVRNTTDVQWSKHTSSKLAESSILSGEPLKIESGTIELELNAGTKLVVEGPAEWSVDGENRISLRTGKLIARVPQHAIGFTVETPTTTIVDLGTEFGVEVGEHGATEVQVLKGKIDVTYALSAKPDEPRQNVRMTAGQAKRFSKHEGDTKLTVVDVPPGTRNLFAKTSSPVPRKSVHGSTEPSTAAGRLPVQGVIASSEFGLQKANRLIDGSGLQSGRHSSDPDDTMWHSALGRVKEEFVLFDLGPPRHLHSMKVWNYNEGNGKLFTSRGVKHADIYVSLSGKRDPLKEPKEWTKVVSGFEFAMASGTDGYDTPDVIPLGNAKARFVAIVILDSLVPDPRGFSSQECVGLSEVQFFGERIEATRLEKPKSP